MTIETFDPNMLPDNGIEILPAQRPAQPSSIGQLMQHAQAMGAAKQLADALCDTEMVPAAYRGKPGNGAAAILYGAELGLTPIQSMQQIFVVHGAPAIYARTAVALVMCHGVKITTVSSANDAVTVRGIRGDLSEESTWDIARAELAGYTKNAKYKTDPQGMLYAKAAMEVCRKIAPDVLLGIPYSAEELELDQPERVPSKRVPAKPRGVDGLREAITPAPTVVVDAEPAPAPAAEPAAAKQPRVATRKKWDAETRKRWVDRMFVLLTEAQCEDRDDQITVIATLAGRPENPPEHRDGITDDELRTVVGALNAASKDGTIGQVVTDLLNTAALKASGYTDDEPPADSDGQAALI
jgi:hypothetical protein